MKLPLECYWLCEGWGIYYEEHEYMYSGTLSDDCNKGIHQLQVFLCKNLVISHTRIWVCDRPPACCAGCLKMLRYRNSECFVKSSNLGLLGVAASIQAPNQKCS